MPKPVFVRLHSRTVSVTVHQFLNGRRKLLDLHTFEMLHILSSSLQAVRKRLAMFSREADKTCSLCLVMMLALGFTFVALFVYEVLRVLH